MSFNVRASHARDAHYLIDIDIKCFDVAWTPEQWRHVADTCVACVATYYGTPIGMAIFRRDDLGGVRIVKLAVKRAYRNQGIGRRLVWNCILHARQTLAPYVYVVVPESMVLNRGPGNILGWLVKLGFQAEAPLLRGEFHSHGEPEDGIRFSRLVRVAG